MCECLCFACVVFEFLWIRFLELSKSNRKQTSVRLIDLFIFRVYRVVCARKKTHHNNNNFDGHIMQSCQRRKKKYSTRRQLKTLNMKWQEIESFWNSFIQINLDQTNGLVKWNSNGIKIRVVAVRMTNKKNKIYIRVLVASPQIKSTKSRRRQRHSWHQNRCPSVCNLW